ncbi:NAD(P)H-dependent flavin oxidoreductase [Alteribacillus iranensis]|uniref:Probable nitronate monooxygenase n=1 Tax=Alteribacillus iranensis TaxID=930128 RepID=A0A1I2B8P9_9BACI|nr:nitronate monooxygenase family protein [Alteribacillus iranensis]SFE52582.1 2-nitropropane dioxygenase precursor [Alteribacillus iranensis]
MNTRITELFGIEYPIVQGGMAHIAYARLAAAVSNAGGLGQITAMSLETPELLRDEISKIRELTSKPFGVNFAIGMGRRPYKEHLKVAIEENVPIISITGGNPTPLIEEVRETEIKTLILTATVRQAQKAEELGADAIIAVGQEGGGHIGRENIGTMVLLPRITESVSIPVLASGGIADGRGFLAAMSLGAEGIEMGTRFIATKESIVSKNYKKALVNLSEMDTVVIKRSLGQPGRAIKNRATKEILEKESKGASFEELKEYLNSTTNKKAIYEGDVDNAYSWAGQAIGLIHDIPSCKELISNIVEEAISINSNIGVKIKGENKNFV